MSPIAPFRDGPVLEVPNRLSYSQVSKYSECGERYRLEYGRGIKGGSWYASVGGSVVHLITEIRDRNRLREAGHLDGPLEEVPDFKSAFLAAVADEERRGVVLKPSGKVLKEGIALSGGPNKKDVEWWLHFGPIFVSAYERWRNESHWQVAFVIGADEKMTPAIELEFKLKVGGEETVGYVDRIFYDMTTNTYIIADIKTGVPPASKLQLGDYRVAIMEQYGIDCPFGVYLTFGQGKPVVTEKDEPVLDDEGNPVLFKSGPRKGEAKTVKVKTEVPAEVELKVSNPISLQAWSREFMEARYAMARTGIMAGVFLPHVTNMCKGCGVNRYCAAYGGDRAVLVPFQEDFIAQREPKKEEISVEDDLTSAE